MMDPQAATKLLFFLFDLVLPLFVGYMLKHWKLVGEAKLSKLMVLAVLVLSPVLTLASVWVIRLDESLIWLPLFGIVMQLVPGLFEFYRTRHRYPDPRDRGSYIMSAALSNRGIVGMLSLYVLFGEIGYAYGRLIMLFGTATVYGVCFPIGQYYHQLAQSDDGDTVSRPSIRSILFSKTQLPILGLIGGAALNLYGVERPEQVGTAVPWMVHIFMWLAIMPIGHAIDIGEMKQYGRLVSGLLAVKFVFTPVVVGLLTIPFGFDPVVRNSLIVMACTPTAVNAVIVAKLHKLNEHLALTAFMLTTVVFLLIVFPILFVVLTVIG